MKLVTAAATCLAVLYAVDAILFDGRYFAAASHIWSGFYAHLRG
jgi:hypothetical protein